MAKVKDPFTNIGLSQQVGLDQRLFQESNETTKQRHNESTNQRGNEPTMSRRSQRSSEWSMARFIETPKPRSSQPIERGARISERHSHDIFKDQVRWMNRIKLEIDEQYGVRITSNSIVQLAIDIVMRDYETSKGDSKIVTAFVKRAFVGVFPAEIARNHG